MDIVSCFNLICFTIDWNEFQKQEIKRMTRKK